MRSFPLKISMLLFGSGCCALLYQLAWLRLLRLIFGSSTAASGVVLGIFMGGLGLGAWWWGKRIDASHNPLLVYGYLELGVSVFALFSYPLIGLLQWGYVALGGSAVLGSVGGSFFRLLFSALLLGLPTFLMGGTLPAAVRAVENAHDTSRRLLGLVYGANTLGAVSGAFLGNFLAIEILGIRGTLLCSALLNTLIFVIARKIALQQAAPEAEKNAETPEDPEATPASAQDIKTAESNESGVKEHVFSSAQEKEASEEEVSPLPQRDRTNQRVAPLALLLTASLIVGFAFLLMELVWYRMLTPLLGGSSYSFGVILMVALLGIGVGGLFYSFGSRKQRPTLYTFALTCALEAFFLILPYALGDQMALWAGYIIALGDAGFWVQVMSWTIIAMIVVFPVAAISGYQFPLLVSLLGAGREQIGQEVGLVYAFNTVGSIMGSLLGGLLLFPILSAPGIWRTLVFLLLLLAVTCLALALRNQLKWQQGVLTLCIFLCAGGMCFSEGPSSFWRHRAIGLGYDSVAPGTQGNALIAKIRDSKRSIAWEAEGVESSVALRDKLGYSFIINGKNDGHCRIDAPTQVMFGLMGAMLHPNPKRVLVIGLGSGSTAGWLASIPSVKRVDVVELEPAIMEVARRCASVNRNVLSNPKVRVIFGDARETLMSTPDMYDLVVSEPSNPFRAGISSLFSQDFYRAVAKRLRPNGILVQWLQNYKISAEIVRMTFSTLRSVFPHLELWCSHLLYDYIFIASKAQLKHHIPTIRTRTQQEPYRTAMQYAWGVQGAEGFYSGFVLSSRFSDSLWQAWKDEINTDDFPMLEFAFSKSSVKSIKVKTNSLRKLAKNRGFFYPRLTGGTLNWQLVGHNRHVRSIAENVTLGLDTEKRENYRKKLIIRHYNQGNLQRAAQLWHAQKDKPIGITDLVMAAELMSLKAPKQALPYIQKLKSSRIVEYHIMLAHWHLRLGRGDDSIRHLHKAFQLAQKDPWYTYRVMTRALDLAKHLVSRYKLRAKKLFDVLGKPFAIHMFHEPRKRLRITLVAMLRLTNRCAEAFRAFEPHFPWEEKLLKQRFLCYKANKDPLTLRAYEEYRRFKGDALHSLGQILLSK